MVDVRLFATLREGRFRQRRIEVPSDGLIAGVLDELGICTDEVGMLLLNGKSTTPQAHLSPGDVISIFPTLGGG